MIRNYFMAAYRGLARNALFSILNIFGLAIGISAALITVLYLSEELSYDRWLPDHDRLYRLETTYYFPGQAPQRLPTAMMPAKTFLEADYAEIELAARLQDSGVSLTYGETMFNEGIAFVDSEIFELFGLIVLEGTLEGAFENPTELILTRSVKEKYFGKGPAVGETLIVDGDIPHKIVAVIEDFPPNSHIDLGVLAPIASPNFYWRDFVDSRWDRARAFTYVKVASGTDMDALEQSLDDFVNRHVSSIRVTGIELEGAALIDLSLRPVTDIHLGSDSPGNMRPGGDPAALLGLSAAVFLLLVIGIINYTNLATARGTLRTREVAMRRILGASRRQVMQQFLGESVFFAFLSLLVALVLAEAALPFFNAFMDTELELTGAIQLSTAAIVIGITVGTGLLGGAYPALVVSRLRPFGALDGDKKAGSIASVFREALVILQFAASIGLIIAATVVYNQNRYASDMDLGYDPHNLVLLRFVNRGPEENEQIHALLRNKLREGSGVISVSSSSAVPSDGRFASITIANLSGSNADRRIESTIVSVSLNFFNSYRIGALAGRVFSEEFTGDRLRASGVSETLFVGGIVLNQAAVRQIGISPEEAIGQTIALYASEGENRYETTIVGVVPDFHLQSTRHAVGPALFYSAPASFDTLTVRISDERKAETLSFIDKTWAMAMPDQIIAREFLDQAVRAQYQTEQRQRAILTVAAVLATLVAGFGLFGLAAFAAEQRTKEIGIRKVLGAEIMDIVRLLTWQFSKPVMVANLLAWPAAWYFLRGWLDGFVYRIDLNPVSFLGAGILALVIAWLTVGGHAFKAARSNPINALRYE